MNRTSIMFSLEATTPGLLPQITGLQSRLNRPVFSRQPLRLLLITTQSIAVKRCRVQETLLARLLSVALSVPVPAAW